MGVIKNDNFGGYQINNNSDGTINVTIGYYTLTNLSKKKIICVLIICFFTIILVVPLLTSWIVNNNSSKFNNIEIHKIDSENQFLEGARLTLKGFDGESEIIFEEGQISIGNGGKVVKSDGIELEWISGKGATELNRLKDGKYILHEVSAPDGYSLAPDQEINIKDGNTVERKITVIDYKVTTTAITTTFISTTSCTTSTETSSSLITNSIDITKTQIITTKKYTIPPTATTIILHIDPLPSSCNDYCIFECNLIDGEYGEGVEIIGYKDPNYNNTEIIIPNIVPGLEDYAVKYIADSAFTGYNNISEVTYIEIPDSVMRIGKFAFSGCNSIEEIYLGRSVEYFGDQCFNYLFTIDPLPDIYTCDSNYSNRVYENNWKHELFDHDNDDRKYNIIPEV